MKVIQGCTGKYLTSGVHKILTRIFGDITVDQVLSGGNYARSIKGYTFLYEALYRLQLKSFLTSSNKEKYFNQITSIILLRVYHEDSKTYTMKSEQPVEEILSFLEERKIDPFLLEPNPLKNIVTNELVHPETAEKILNIFDIALSVNKEFIDERYIKKEKTINDTITQNNFPSFKTMPKIQKFKDVKAKETHEKHIQRYIYSFSF